MGEYLCLIYSSIYVQYLIKSLEKVSMTHFNQTPPLKVHYFYIRGQCQPVRNLLYHIEVEFEDIMHEKTPANSIEASFNLGFPMVQDGDTRVHDSIAIMNYVCRKYNRVELLGLTPQSLAKIQQVAIRYSLQKKRIIASIFDMINYLSINDETEREKLVREKLRKMVIEYKFLDYCLRSTSQAKGYVCNSLSLMDFLYYEICFYLHGFFYDQLKKHKTYKYFLEFKKHFEKLPFFNKNESKISEKYVFFEFDDVEMNKKIEKYWKGSSKCLKQIIRQF